MGDITFGSVCSGIEAASVAWKPLGWRAVWLSEIEPFPCAVLAHHYPHVPNLGNMLLIPGLLRNGGLTAPDVFTGGTPCQAFSIAGLRNSLDDARGNLSLTFCKIADEIDIQRAANGLLPCIVKWENVPGVLSTEDNAFGCFLAGLAGEDEALVPEPCPAAGKSGKFWKWNKKTGRHSLSWPKCGAVIGPQRAVAWRVLDAQYHALAQRRNRVFVVASARKGFDPAAILLEFDSVRRDSPPSRSAGQDVAGTLNARTDGGGFPGTDEACSGYVQPVGIDLRNGTVTDQVAQTIQAGGHGVDPGGTPHVLGSIAFNSREDCVSSTEVFGALGTSSPQAQAVSYAIQAGALRENPLSGPDGVGVQADVAYTLEARAEVQAVAFSVALRGRDGGGTAEMGDDLATCLRASTGGGDKPHVLAPVCLTGDITHALKAHGFDGSEDGTGRGRGQPIVPSMAFAQNTRDEVRMLGGDGEIVRALAAQPGMKQTTYVAPGGMAVRRLMPVECARLQGFDDDYLPQVQVRGKPPADGPMYKAIGNSWAIPCVRWIGERIDKQLRGAK